MAQLQFLSGLRDGEIQDLMEEFGLTLGTAADAYIPVKDQGLEAKHAVIYSVQKQFYAKPESPQAKVFVNFRPLPPEGAAINDKDILMFGRSVIAKFWRGQAPSTGGAATLAPGASPAELTKANKDRDDALAKVSDLEKKLAQAQSVSGAVDGLRREKEDLAKQLSDSKNLEQARAKEKDNLAGEITTLKAGKADLEKRIDDLGKQLKSATDDRDSTKKAKEKVEADLAAEKKKVADAEAAAAKTKPELEKKDKELETLRKAIEPLKASEALAKRDRRQSLREGSDLDKMVGVLGVPDSLKEKLSNAIKDAVDKEVLAREGATVPLRGLRCPGCNLDLEQELGGMKTRRKLEKHLRSLGVSNLTPDEVKALLQKARAKA